MKTKSLCTTYKEFTENYFTKKASKILGKMTICSNE